MEIELEVNKEAVYTEVARTSSYTGAKMDDDVNAYERIFTTDEDRTQLERFWQESCVAFCEAMKRFLTDDTPTVDGHRFVVEFSRSFDPALLPSMRSELFSYFVMNITAKWFGFTNKGETVSAMTAAGELLEGIHRKALYKRKPQRPRYD